MRRKSMPRQNTSSAGPSTNKQKRRRSGQLALMEIRRFQNSVDFLIPRSSFAKLLHEIIQNIADTDMRISLLAIQAIQESAELYLVQFFQDAYACTLHRSRVTLNIKDMRLVRFLRGPSDPGNS